jgi:hypothetical protein
LPLAIAYSTAAAAIPERDRRIEVAARDRPERIGRRQHGQPEGQRDPGQADADLREFGCQHGAAAAAEHEPEGADELGEVFSQHDIPLVEKAGATPT